MHVFAETFRGATANALRRAVGREEFGLLSFEMLKAHEQRVVFGVGDFRVGVNVVKLFVAAKLVAQTLDFAFDSLDVGRQLPCYSSKFGCLDMGISPQRAQRNTEKEEDLKEQI